MRKFAHVAAAAGSLAVALMAGAFAAGPGASTAPAAPGGSSLARIRQGGPMSIAGNRPAAPGPFSARTVNTVSGNWAGYVAGRPGVKFRYVRAVFFVPYLDCASTPSSFSGHWVGLDGAGNSTVEQDGILAACQGTTPQYSARYEMFPLPPVYCQRMSAEAISEAPSSGSSILPLTNFRAESFSDVVVTNSRGERGGLRGPGWDTMSVTTENLHQHQAVVLDQPTEIFRGRSFDCYRMAAS